MSPTDVTAECRRRRGFALTRTRRGGEGDPLSGRTRRQACHPSGPMADYGRTTMSEAPRLRAGRRTVEINRPDKVYHRRVGRRGGVQADDPRPFGTKSGSAERVQERGRRHRTPSARRIRRTCERLTWMPSAWAATARVSSVHSAGPNSSGAHNSSTGSHRSRPGGSILTSAMTRERSCSVIRRLRPCPPRSSSPATPARLKRCSQQRTVLGLHPNTAAITGTRCPDQLSCTIRARTARSRGAFRAPTSRFTTFSSAPSRLGRAHNTIARHPPRAPAPTPLPAHLPTQIGTQH